MSIHRTASRGSPTDVAQEPWTPPRVLVADPDLELRTLLRDMLRKQGYLVEEAATGIEMRAQLGLFNRRHRSFDLIVTCNRMPGADGLDVIEELRNCLDPNCWCTPVIVLTNRNDGDLYADAVRLGAVTLDKPLDLDLFMRHAAAFASRTPSRDSQPPRVLDDE